GDDLDWAAAARGERRALTLDQPHHRCADRAETGKPHFQRRNHEAPQSTTRATLGASAPGRKGNDVVQLVNACVEESAHVARGLADALLVLDECDAHI